MAENSKIGWTTHTVNFWTGCTKVSEECRYCYIQKWLRRQGREPFNGPRRTGAETWKKARKYDTDARGSDEAVHIFTCSLSDFFHEGADEWRDEAWDVIRDCDQVHWQILTKRPELIAERLPSDWGDGYPHVWLGVTVGCEKSIPRLAELSRVPAKCRFISAEPLLERLDLSPYLKDFDWLITGCEQAARDKRRRMDLDWVRDIDSQCQRAGLPHFFKQYYATKNGNEFGTPCKDGMLDSRFVQAFPDMSNNPKLAASIDQWFFSRVGGD